MLERFGLKVVQLFKLILLQKRVLFFHSPVRPLCTSILALLALFPGLVESGLDSSTAFENRDSEIAETIDVPTQVGNSGRTVTQSESVNSLKMKLSAWKDKLYGSQNNTPSGTDSSDDRTSSRESSFEDLRAPTALEMEIEVQKIIMF